MFWVLLVGPERQLLIRTDGWESGDRELALRVLTYLHTARPRVG